MDGGTILVGAPEHDAGGYLDEGCAYIFTGSGSAWTQQAQLMPSMRYSYTFRGGAVALRGDVAVLGQSFVPTFYVPSGEAVVFRRTSAAWVQDVVLSGDAFGVGDHFGAALALDGDTLIVGAPAEAGVTPDGGKIPNVGAIYVERLVSGSAEISLHDGASIAAPELQSGQAAPVDFGFIALGGVVTRDFTIRNTGDSPLLIRGLAGFFEFSVLNAPASIPTGQSPVFQARFTASSVGSAFWEMAIFTNDADEPLFLVKMTAATYPDAYFAWAAAAGLTGDLRHTAANPASDGVANLLKYAFNLDPTTHDRRTLIPGTGTVGLPAIEEDNQSPSHAFVGLRIEFVRRIDGGITYFPEFSRDLSDWTNYYPQPVITPLGGGWERVIVIGSYERTPGMKIFGRVRVRIP